MLKHLSFFCVKNILNYFLLVCHHLREEQSLFPASIT